MPSAVGAFGAAGAGVVGGGTQINPGAGTPGPNGSLTYFAGGGAGGDGGAGSGNSGGAGGGGPTSTSGTGNTGGGCGGEGYSGGSGIVVIRYRFK